MPKVTPFLMFQGNAEEAMNYYISLVEGSEIKSISRYGPDGPGEEGSVMQAVFNLNGQDIMCIDSNIQHEFSFTPSFSFFLECDSEEEIDRLYGQLSEGGTALMPIGDYGFSKKFGWINDKYGVSWQMTLPK
ncbi:VOC family protein [Bacillus salacetis]|uniref:VOC family protein n=1 Tax=Bacillus salacetis TaxID=2315464 RepID=A0A3A1R1W0_9BACI|nr:VOC family protein [Bacillus salacetis]RIW33975.1 VOC family protein [Bacillus salacetis]